VDPKSGGPRGDCSARSALECGREAAAFSAAGLRAAVLLYRRLRDWNWGCVRNPASKLAERKAAASRPHSKPGFARRGCRLAQTLNGRSLRQPAH